MVPLLLALQAKGILQNLMGVTAATDAENRRIILPQGPVICYLNCYPTVDVNPGLRYRFFINS